MPTRTFHLLLCALLIFSCAPLHAGISCYTNYLKGNEKNLLGSHGKRGIFLMDCPDKTECFEALANPVFGLDGAMYSSGCGANCPNWGYELECKKCSQSKCNRDIVKSIWTTHRECFVANNEKVMSKRRAYCTKGIESCFLSEERDENDVTRYSANCGTGLPGGKICKENLCNGPPDLRKQVQDEVRVIEEEDAKENALVPKSDQVTGNIKESGNTNSDGGNSGISGGGSNSGSGDSGVTVRSGSSGRSGDSNDVGSDSGRGSDRSSGSGGVGNTGGGSGGSRGTDGGGGESSGNSRSASSDDKKNINQGNNGKKHSNRDDSDKDKKGDKKEDRKNSKNGSGKDGVEQQKKRVKNSDDEDTDLDNSGFKLSAASVEILLLITCTLETLYLR